MAGPSETAEIMAALAVLENAVDSDVELPAFFQHWSRLQRRKLAEALGEADAMWAAARGRAAPGSVTGPPRAKVAAPIPPPQQPAASSSSAPSTVTQPASQGGGRKGATAGAVGLREVCQCGGRGGCLPPGLSDGDSLL